MPDVVVRDTGENLAQDLAAVFDYFGGVKKLIAGRKVLVKPNAVNFGPGQATDVKFLEALFAILRDSGAGEICLMEACTAGSLTRVVYRVLGYDKLCKKFNVRPVFLDEGKTSELMLEAEDTPALISSFLQERLLDRRSENFYLSVPRLKTHSMSHVTLGIKNQQGLLAPISRMRDHNFNLGRRLVKILQKFKPEFTLVEGITATIYGHFPLLRDLEKSIINTRVVLGGDDVVAVDTVGAKIFGYDSSEIDHIRIAGELGLGCADLNKIKIIGSLDRFKTRYPYLPDLHPPANVRCIYGKERACVQGCRGNTEISIDMFSSDYHGKRGFNFICGKGIDKKELENLDGNFLVVGPCAAEEVGEYLKSKYRGRKIFIVPEHNDLASMSGKVVRLMRPNILGIVPLSPLTSVNLFIRARLNGSFARLINFF